MGPSRMVLLVIVKALNSQPPPLSTQILLRPPLPVPRLRRHRRVVNVKICRLLALMAQTGHTRAAPMGELTATFNSSKILAAIAEEALGTLVFAQHLKQQLLKQLMRGARPTAWLMCLDALPIQLTAPVRKINAAMF